MIISEGLTKATLKKGEYYIEVISLRTVYVNDIQTDETNVVVSAMAYNAQDGRTEYINPIDGQLREPSTAETNTMKGV